MKLYIIGCGGVGSWLAPATCKLYKPLDVVLVDGDKLEKKNLDRQLFDEDFIGLNKAYALGEKYGCNSIHSWFSTSTLELLDQDWLLVCVDNHLARNCALQECDEIGCKAIFGANETWSAEAFYYQREWRGSPLDPRICYPEIATDRRNDPRAAAIGCTGEAQEQNRQLAGANFMAASLMLQLLAIWQVKAPKVSEETRGFLPHHIISNLTKIEVRTVKQTTEKGQQNGNSNATNG